MADPYFWIRPGPDPLTLSVTYLYFTQRYNLYWGDSERQQQVNGATSVSRKYPGPGAYMLRAKTTGSVSIEDIQVVIPPTWPPAVTLDQDEDNPRLYAVTAHDPGTGVVHRLRVNWRDGGSDPIQEWWGLPGSKLTRYLSPGVHTVSVYDLSTTGQHHWRDFEVSDDSDPDFTVDVQGSEATLTVTANTEGAPLSVAWGDLTVPEAVTGTTATHTYPATAADATYLVQLYDSDGPRSTTKPVTVPGGSR